MAKTKTKTKAKPVEEEDVAEDAATEDVDVDVDADEPIAEDDADSPKDPDEPAEGDGDDEPADDEPSVDLALPKAKPKPKISKTAIALILLNWIAAPTFLVFAYLDHIERTKYSYRTLVNYIQIWGLPLDEEEDFPSLSNQTRPVMKLSAEQLRKAFDERRTGGSVPKGELFVPVEEPVTFRLRKSDMTSLIVEEVFGSKAVPDEVATLDEAIVKLKEKLPALIDAAATEALAKNKTEEDKRKFVEATLFPLAWDVWQVKKLDDTLKAAKDGAELDNLVKESIKRRLYYDILAPINVFRPSDLTHKDAKAKFRVERIADLDVKIEKIKEFLDERLDAAIAKTYKTDVHIGDMWKSEQTVPGEMERDSVEKRRYIAFVLFTVSQVQNPVTQKKLYDKSVERAQVICGMYEFTNASIDYVRTVRVLEDRIAQSIAADRQGWIFRLQDKTLARTKGFIDEYEREVDRLVKVVEQIDAAEKRLTDAKSQRDHFKKIHDQRVLQHAATVDRLIKARTGTKSSTDELVKELRDQQQKLHEALEQLSDAAERNFAIEAEIRRIELDYLRKEQPKKGKK